MVHYVGKIPHFMTHGARAPKAINVINNQRVCRYNAARMNDASTTMRIEAEDKIVLIKSVRLIATW